MLDRPNRVGIHALVELCTLRWSVPRLVRERVMTRNVKMIRLPHIVDPWDSLENRG